MFWQPSAAQDGSKQPDPSKVKSFQRSLALITDSSAALAARVIELHRLCDEAGFGRYNSELLRAGAIKVLVQMATEGFPPDGDLSRSSSPWDQVAQCSAKMHHSLRRVACGFLAEVSNYPVFVQEMQACGLFGPTLLLMLDKLLPKYPYGATIKKMYGCGRGTEQGHFIAQRLVNLLASSITHLPMAEWVAGCAAPLVVRHQPLPGRGGNKGPYEHWTGDVDPMASMIDQLSRVSAQGTPSVVDSQRKAEMMRDGDMEPMPYDFSRLMANLCNCRPSALVPLVELGAVPMLKGLPTGNKAVQGCCSMAIPRLEAVYTQHALEQSTKAAASESAAAKHAAALKAQGNDAFKAGDNKTAVKHYTEAIKRKHDEPALFNNRSLCLLRQGNAPGAMRDALEALHLEPRGYRGWARMGDACRARSRLQSAQLCFSQALALLKRTDEELQARLEDTRLQLAGAPWRWSDVPCFEDVAANRMGAPPGVRPTMPCQAMAEAADFCGWLPGASRQYDPVGMRAVLSGLMSGTAPRAVRDSDAFTACVLLKPAYITACALEEPASKCGGLPFSHEHWVLSWTDTFAQLPDTGLVRCMVSITDPHGRAMGSSLALGPPSAPVLLGAIMRAIVRPLTGTPGRPRALYLAHRCMPQLPQLHEALRGMGIEVAMEAHVEAVSTAALHSTDPDGFNWRGEYVDEVLSEEEEEDGEGTAGTGAAKKKKRRQQLRSGPAAMLSGDPAELGRPYGSLILLSNLMTLSSMGGMQEDGATEGPYPGVAGTGLHPDIMAAMMGTNGMDAREFMAAMAAMAGASVGGFGGTGGGRGGGGGGRGVAAGSSGRGGGGAAAGSVGRTGRSGSAARAQQQGEAAAPKEAKDKANGGSSSQPSSSAVPKEAKEKASKANGSSSGQPSSSAAPKEAKDKTGKANGSGGGGGSQPNDSAAPKAAAQRQQQQPPAGPQPRRGVPAADAVLAAAREAAALGLGLGSAVETAAAGAGGANAQQPGDVIDLTL